MNNFQTGEESAFNRAFLQEIHWNKCCTNQGKTWQKSSQIRTLALHIQNMFNSTGTSFDHIGMESN
jgi:hypothetical protein